MVNRLRAFLSCFAWCICFPLALLICLTFPFWFFALTIFCAYMAGSAHATR